MVCIASLFPIDQIRNERSSLTDANRSGEITVML